MQKGKDLYTHLDGKGLLEYGSNIPASIVHNIADITYPKTGTRKQFQDMQLLELAVVDYVRNILLGEGKALVQDMGDYRILLPSENVKYIERYMSSADKKLKRALKLSRNTPSVDTQDMDASTVKIMLKRESIRKQAQRRDSLK